MAKSQLKEKIKAKTPLLKNAINKRYDGFVTLSGIDAHVLKKFAFYAFGKDSFCRINKNLKKLRFDLFIFNAKDVDGKLISTDQSEVDYFRNFFKDCVEVILVPVEYNGLN